MLYSILDAIHQVFIKSDSQDLFLTRINQLHMCSMIVITDKRNEIESYIVTIQAKTNLLNIFYQVLWKMLIFARCQLPEVKMTAKHVFIFLIATIDNVLNE